MSELPLQQEQEKETELKVRLSQLLRSNATFLCALEAAQQLGLHSWAIGAGAIRSLVWDELHGFVVPTPVLDWDLVYYDVAGDESDEECLKQRLSERCPQLAWDVVNQAIVHRWLSRQNACTVPAFANLEEGIASWPETATCVAATLDTNGGIHILAPLGLADLFGLRVRFNSRCTNRDAYRQRLLTKRLEHRWPRLQIIPA